MANVQAQGMKSFGVVLGRENATNHKMLRAWDSVRSMKPSKPEGKPISEGKIDRAGEFTMFDLPMSYFESAKQNKTTNSCIDLISEVECNFDFDKIFAVLENGEYKDLPAPFCTSKTETNVPLTMNVHVGKDDVGKYYVIKYFTFLSQTKVAVIRDELIQGLFPHQLS